MALLVLAARVTSLPRTTWEGEEVRFVDALRTYDPLHQQPEAPGYPLYVATGRFLNFFVHDPFTTLIVISVVASLVGAVVTALSAAALLGSAWAGAAAAVVLYFSPAMLVFDPLPNGEAVVVMCIALAVFALVRDRPVMFGVAAAAAIGVHPEVLPAIVVLFVAGCALLQNRRRAIVAFVVSVIVFIAPLVEVIGVGRLIDYATGSFRALQTSSAAAGLNASDALLRFTAHPWGGKFLSFPLLIVAVAGFAFLVRNSRVVVVLAAFALVHTAFVIAVGDRGDGVQPAIPALIAVALFAAAALSRWPALAFIASLAYGSCSYAYVLPILKERRVIPSAPAAATAWARTTLPPNATVLYDTSMEPYARHCDRTIAPLAAFNPLAVAPDMPLFILADGGSRHAGSKTFVWSDSDAYGKITTERYRVTSLVPWPGAERYQPLHGVYGYQTAATGETWWWLAADAAFEVRRRAASIAVTLALPIDAAIAENSVTVSAGSAAQVVKIGRGQVVTAVIPLAANEVRLRSAQTFIPADGRRLAVQLLAVEQRP